jgi:DNA-binding XRE family transcriptional regulator
VVEVVGTDEFSDWFHDLGDSDQDAVARVVDMLESAGVSLPFPYGSAIEGSRYALRELRIKSRGKQIRVLYAFDVERQAVLLIGGDKTGHDRFYEVAIPKAERLLEAIPRRTGCGAQEEVMKVQRWADIKARSMTKERIAKVRRAADEELLALSLRELREVAGKNQVEMAELVEVTQSALSRMERREDNPISTLRRYVEALGGELEIVAVLGNKRITLTGV